MMLSTIHNRDNKPLIMLTYTDRNIRISSCRAVRQWWSLNQRIEINSRMIYCVAVSRGGRRPPVLAHGKITFFLVAGHAAISN